MPVTELPNGFSVRTYSPPPRDFDPITAPDRLLLHYGFPARPDPKETPDLYKRWERALSRRPINYVVPTFQANKSRMHRPRIQGRKNRADTAENWAGSVVFAPDPQHYSFQLVSGVWTISNPIPPSSDGTWYRAAEWIGIDGWETPPSQGLLQAGTDIGASSSWPLEDYYAWFEWYPHVSVIIAPSSFEIDPGDVLQCTICPNSDTAATIFFHNLSDGQATSLTVTAPSGISLGGSTAEWIVERIFLGSDTYMGLVNYTRVYFDDSFAYYASGRPGSGTNWSSEVGVGSGMLVFMENSAGNTLSAPTIETQNLMRIDWEAAR